MESAYFVCREFKDLTTDLDLIAAHLIDDRIDRMKIKKYIFTIYLRASHVCEQFLCVLKDYFMCRFISKVKITMNIAHICDIEPDPFHADNND